MKVAEAKQRFGIVGTAPALEGAVSRALQVAPIDLSVLVTGESGSGKEFFPKIIHAASPRKHAKYIAVNCGAIPEGTIDSELFGHEKGAFTGAVGSRKGYFEEADGGTIFLDEVAELPLTTQARLLRVLESGEFIKVGSSEVQRTNLRVVAATNVDLPRAVAEGRFREDLYYRLSTVLIHVPPLRERGNDIVLLARKFAADFSERQMTAPVTFAEDARERLLRYRWPGNVRQLKNIVDQVALFHAGTEVTAADLEEYLPEAATRYTPALAGSGGHDYATEREALVGMVLGLRRELEELRREVDRLSGARGAVEPLLPFAETENSAGHTPGVTAALVPTGQTAAFSHSTPAEPLPLSLEDSERDTIRRALERNGGVRKDTAAELNISERTLYRKIREYGLE
ncbi:MAG: sigma-54 dependent transcriptional regulator [Candidatus Amulumruptor caecigallinarius]|nr:sigma-54 dependent transcriptional regulator [Candidatus Amulumruptor caecigallinarius]MCM1397533.1 sigma-54 dependent transcriptional regulator [Candidatus Amulumruptor caecigallinarius]MCM1454435.1 sigma-54 dependent transcriptional regulator [bacterium]